MAKKETKEQEIDTNDVSKKVIASLFEHKDHKKYIWNNVEQVETLVSAGSLNLDAQISLREGVHRFCGPPGAGKTSQSCEVAKNFLKKYKKGKVLWIKAEFRLSTAIQARSGLKFVTSPEAWDYGTALIYECNTFETIIETINQLLAIFQENKERILIVLDSADGLRLAANDKNDYNKEKVAGPQMLMKRYLRDNYPLIVKTGTIFIVTSQVSSPIAQNDFAPPPLTSGSGGNALLHWASYILEFQGRYPGKDSITPAGVGEKVTKDNPVIGHMVRVRIKKTDKENEMDEVAYPVKHGRTGGNSIWVEKEIIPHLINWKLLKLGGSWYSFDSELIKEVKKDLGLEMIEKVQGEPKVLEYLEANPNLTTYLFDRIRTVIEA